MQILDVFVGNTIEERGRRDATRMWWSISPEKAKAITHIRGWRTWKQGSPSTYYKVVSYKRVGDRIEFEVEDETDEEALGVLFAAPVRSPEGARDWRITTPDDKPRD